MCTLQFGLQKSFIWNRRAARKGHIFQFRFWSSWCLIDGTELFIGGFLFIIIRRGSDTFLCEDFVTEKNLVFYKTR